MDPIAIKKAIYEEIARYINDTQFSGPLGEKYQLEVLTITAKAPDANLPDVALAVEMRLVKHISSSRGRRVDIPVVMPTLNRHMKQIEVGNILYTDNYLLNSNHSDFELTATARVIAHYLDELNEYGLLIKRVVFCAED